MYNLPFGPTAEAIEHDKLALPVPLSITMLPGLMLSFNIIIEISAKKSIYVL